MPKSKTRIKLENKVLKHFQNKYGEERFSLPEDVRIFHYSRNDRQAPVIDYAQIILGEYSLVSDAKSAFHRFGIGNENNSKWLGPTGRDEYVFKFDAGADEFILVTDPVNMGTFNLVGTNNPAYPL